MCPATAAELARRDAADAAAAAAAAAAGSLRLVSVWKMLSCVDKSAGMRVWDLSLQVYAALSH
jgi:hypothetical protein